MANLLRGEAVSDTRLDFNRVQHATAVHAEDTETASYFEP
jgi:hypothetical protein